jgi:hypothetical protein
MEENATRFVATDAIKRQQILNRYETALSQKACSPRSRSEMSLRPA